ncbi:SurA N-terminal domain-containing protein [Paenibacillus sp. QZ-Y1]|uniref:SurA N-terminal domain-containing protein n=1 Tax=Paenibacillus sp. QZ-Y1 TaxID=3414511 RepID=UPI003F7B2EB9
MKKKYISIMMGVFAALLLTGSVIYSQSTIPKEQTKDGFDEIQLSLEKEKLNRNLTAESPLVVGEGIEITRDKFIFYKKSSELISSLQNNNNLVKQASQSDEDIINELIKSELTVQNAKNLGLEATAQEIDDVITAEKAALNDPDLDPDNYLVKELMSNRIRITGLTEEEFWNSEETRYGYEKAILLGKLFDQLVKEGTINDITDFNEYQTGLLNASQDKLEINYAAIK